MMASSRPKRAAAAAGCGLLVLVGAPPAVADGFQLVDRQGRLISHVRVEVRDPATGEAVAQRYTDRIGRFGFDRRGTWRIEAEGQSARITVTGTDDVRRVRLD